MQIFIPVCIKTIIMSSAARNVSLARACLILCTIWKRATSSNVPVPNLHTKQKQKSYDGNINPGRRRNANGSNGPRGTYSAVIFTLAAAAVCFFRSFFRTSTVIGVRLIIIKYKSVMKTIKLKHKYQARVWCWKLDACTAIGSEKWFYRCYLPEANGTSI